MCIHLVCKLFFFQLVFLIIICVCGFAVIPLGWNKTWLEFFLLACTLNKNLSRCSFTVVTSDGSLQHIEISREPNTSINNALTQKGKLVQNVCSVDYHLELSMLAVVSCSDSITQSTGNILCSICYFSHALLFWLLF